MRKASVSLLMMFIVGCMTAGEHQQSLHSSREREMTVGVVQKEIHVGMSQADVATALGSPNIVSKDSEGDESWIYDKIATEVSYSRESGEAGVAALGGSPIGSWLVGLGGSASYSRSAGATAQTQKTLTVVIKFDEKGLVKNLAYHASKF
ncbi:MAG: hypothetical protein ACYSR5_12820 [Planctomycetota bacterium]|jgi:outer membrane protein assembly factor BamE (lipoprotein component of BamABCDE complex)